MMLSLILISPMMKEFDVLAAVVVFVHVLPIESAIGVIIYYREMLQYIDFVCQPLFVIAAAESVSTLFFCLFWIAYQTMIIAAVSRQKSNTPTQRMKKRRG